MLTLQCGNRNADAAPAALLERPARPGVGPRAPGAGAPPLRPAHRERHYRARLPAADGREPRPVRGRAAHQHDVALRGVGVPHWVVVHDVGGLAPGVYRWPGLTAPVRPGELRDELYRVCLEQALGRDAAFVAIAAADVGKFGDAEYRDA